MECIRTYRCDRIGNFYACKYFTILKSTVSNSFEAVVHNDFCQSRTVIESTSSDTFGFFGNGYGFQRSTVIKAVFAYRFESSRQYNAFELVRTMESTVRKCRNTLFYFYAFDRCIFKYIKSYRFNPFRKVDGSQTAFGQSTAFNRFNRIGKIDACQFRTVIECVFPYFSNRIGQNDFFKHIGMVESIGRNCRHCFGYGNGLYGSIIKNIRTCRFQINRITE